MDVEVTARTTTSTTGEVRTDKPHAGPDAAADEALASLSPSRASDFMTCPLLYRFRVIDRLPEAPRPEAVRGTVVHAVLERLFDLPASERTAHRAGELVAPTWEELRAASPELEKMFGAEGPELAGWLQQCEALLHRYFTLEDPSVLEPAEREVYVETMLDSGLRLRGYIDRVDVAPTGEIRIVDYKTGRAPGPHLEATALFQMRFYALVVWRIRGVLPRMLQLVYLGSGELLRYEPEERDLLATERKVEALWRAIRRATERGDWRARTSALCHWCDHRALCPAWGGTPPPLPAPLPAPLPGSQPAPQSAHQPTLRPTSHPDPLPEPGPREAAAGQ